MTFKLTKKSENSVKTTFHVLNGDGDICGSINVQNAEVPDLLRHWVGPADRAQHQAGPVANAKPMPLMGRMPRAMVLRGC